MMRRMVQYVIRYMTDGTIEEYDISDPRVPLPRWLSLVVVNLS